MDKQINYRVKRYSQKHWRFIYMFESSDTNKRQRKDFI